MPSVGKRSLLTPRCRLAPLQSSSSPTASGAGDIQVYLREPLSGTMNTTEYTVFRYPDFSGNSQETGVAGHNPLNGLACGTGPQAWAFCVERYSRLCIRIDRRTQPRICKGM